MSRRLANVVLTLATVGVTAATLVAVAPTAGAEPGVTTRFQPAASATRFTGQAFDTCTAPSLSQMNAWKKSSPYGAIAVYVGGPNRGCSQPNLTTSWVNAVSVKGWKLMPIYVGLQAPCTTRSWAKIVPDRAAAQGKESAVDAVKALSAVGMRPGSAVYIDMEAYNARAVGCSEAVLTYLSAYTKELHRRGYLSGVYGKATSAIGDLSKTYNSKLYARPDAIWLAEWDGVNSLAGFAGVPATSWSNGQRAKQYIGDHHETHGGVRLRIDSNRLDGPVATVIRTYKTTARTNLRAAPTQTSAKTGVVEKNVNLRVICQAPGKAVSGTKIWNKLSNGAYISDHYVTTSSATGYSSNVPRCRYPYQVTATPETIVRNGPGATQSQTKTLPSGALAWTTCQREAAELTGTSRVWNQLHGGGWVPDNHLATASRTTFSPAAPRC